MSTGSTPASFLFRAHLSLRLVACSDNRRREASRYPPCGAAFSLRVILASVGMSGWRAWVSGRMMGKPDINLSVRLARVGLAESGLVVVAATVCGGGFAW